MGHAIWSTRGRQVESQLSQWKKGDSLIMDRVGMSKLFFVLASLSSHFSLSRLNLFFYHWLLTPTPSQPFLSAPSCTVNANYWCSQWMQFELPPPLFDRNVIITVPWIWNVFMGWRRQWDIVLQPIFFFSSPPPASETQNQDETWFTYSWSDMSCGIRGNKCEKQMREARLSEEKGMNKEIEINVRKNLVTIKQAGASEVTQLL